LNGFFNNGDVQQALLNFERVTGVREEDVRAMLQYAPESQLTGWINRLMTWKDIGGGKDIFLKGLGSFNAAKLIDDHIVANRNVHCLDFIRLFKGTFLRKQRSTLEEVPAKAGSVQAVQEALASSKALDLAAMLQAEKKDRKTKHRPPYNRHLADCNEEQLWQYIFSGYVAWLVPDECHMRTASGAQPADSLYPFWLPSVDDLRARAYFAEAIGSTQLSHARAIFLEQVLSQSETSVQRRHLLRYRHYWNNPNNIGSLQEAVLTFGEEVWAKLGDELPPPQQLTKKLQLLETGAGFLHLQTLPDRGRIRVLRSKARIIETGQRLHNCLASTYMDQYAMGIEQKRLVLVCLYGNNGKPFAVGNYNLTGRLWEEVKETCNHYPSMETRAAFSEYENDVLRPWISKGM